MRSVHSGKFLGVRSDWRDARAIWVINRKDAVQFKDKADADKVAATWPSVEVIES